MATLDYAQPPRPHRTSFLRLLILYSLGYLLITPIFAATEELWGESLNNIFVGVASLYPYATNRAGRTNISSSVCIGLALNSLAYGAMLASIHQCLNRARAH